MDNNISDFIRDNSINPLGSITLLPPSLLRNLEGWGSHPLTVIDSENRLEGIVIPIPIPIDINEIKYRGIDITYLCVSLKSRNRGITRQLISKIRDLPAEIGYSIGTRVDYPTTKVGLPIRSWFRPLQPDLARSLGFEFPTTRQRQDRNSFRDRLAYSTNLPSNLRVARLIENRGYSEYLKFTDNYRIRYRPSPEEWIEWVKFFPTYGVERDQKMVGIFTLVEIPSIVRGKTVKTSFLILTGGSDLIDLLRAAIYQAHRMESVILYGYQIGGIRESEIKEIRGQLNRNPVYLSFHLPDPARDFEKNPELNNLRESEINLPIL